MTTFAGFENCFFMTGMEFRASTWPSRPIQSSVAQRPQHSEMQLAQSLDCNARRTGSRYKSVNTVTRPTVLMQSPSIVILDLPCATWCCLLLK